MMTSHVLLQKCELLDPFERKMVVEFIDFLLSKHRASKAAAEKKAILARTSVWDDDSLKQIETVRQDMNRWTPPTF